MFIRRYGNFPAFFVPDQGERVLAARSPAGPFCEAWVTSVKRHDRDRIRIDFVWCESAELTPTGSGVQEGTKGHVYVHADDVVPLVRRIPADYRRRPPTDTCGAA